MEKGKPMNRFLDYVSRPLTYDQLSYLHTLNGVTIEKVEVFKDFTTSLTYLIYDTYLGDDTIKNETDRLTHFNWCWKKNIENFLAEGLRFKESGEHYYYHLNYFMDIFYLSEWKDDVLFNKILFYWNEIITMNKAMTKSEYDIFIELYKIQNKHFLNNS